MEVNPKFEKWARSIPQPLDLTRSFEGPLYADPVTEMAYVTWITVSGACAKICDDGVRLMSRVKGEGAARAGGAIRDAFGLDQKIKVWR